MSMPTKSPGSLLARERWTPETRMTIPETVAEANRLLVEHGSKAAAARAWGISRQTFLLRLSGKQTAPK